MGAPADLPVNWLDRSTWPSDTATAGRDLPERAPWTFVGTVDGTALTYDPAPPNGAPATLDRGQVVRFGASDPFVVHSKR